MQRLLRINRLLLMLALLAGLAGSVAAADFRSVDEHWYELLLNEQKAGWMSVIVADDGTRYRMTVESSLRFDRGTQAVEITSRSTSIERHDGEPVSFAYEQRTSSRPVQRRWEFGPDSVRQIVVQGGRETVSELPLPDGGWLMPVAAERFAKVRREAGAEAFDYRTVDPEGGLKPMTVSSRRDGRRDVEVDGRTIPVSVWVTRTDLVPIDAIEYYSSDGHLVYQEITTGLGVMKTRVTSREAARARPDAAPELMASTFVSVDRPIRRVDELRGAQLRIRAKQGDLPELPSTGYQRVEPEDDGSILLHVDLDGPPIDEPAPGDADRGTSSMVNADDALVGKLARSAARHADDDDMMAQAEAMRRRVNRHISRKGLETAFASAAETAIMRQGDCSEHAVLLCAMLRSQGIPARVASGLVYVDQFGGHREVFGWHMWTQAWIDGRWHDLDATLRVPYHAGHVLTSTSSLADDEGTSDMASMILLIGNIEIDVVDLDWSEGRPRPDDQR